MKTEEVFNIINTHAHTTSYLVTMDNGEQACGRCTGLIVRDDGMKMAIEHRETIYAQTLLSVENIDSIIPYKVSYEDFNDINISLGCEVNNYIEGYLANFKNNIGGNLSKLKTVFGGKSIRYYLKDGKGGKEPCIEGKVAGIHDVDLVLSQHKLELNWIFEVATDKGIKQVALSEIKDVAILMD